MCNFLVEIEIVLLKETKKKKNSLGHHGHYLMMSVSTELLNLSHSKNVQSYYPYELDHANRNGNTALSYVGTFLRKDSVVIENHSDIWYRLQTKRVMRSSTILRRQQCETSTMSHTFNSQHEKLPQQIQVTSCYLQRGI